MRFLLIFLLVPLAYSCKQSSSFKGGGGQQRVEAVATTSPVPQGPPPSGFSSVTPVNPTEEKTAGDGRVTLEFYSQVTQTKQPLDIIFAVDTSGSMREEIGFLQQNMARLIQIFDMSGQQLDYQITVIAKDFVPIQSNRLMVVDYPVGSWDALTVLLQFFSGNLNQLFRGPTLLLRPNAAKEIIVVTDDDFKFMESSTVDPNQFAQYLLANPTIFANTHFNGFVGLPTSAQNPNCVKEKDGTAYIALSQMPQFRGFIFDICTPDWTQLITLMAQNIVSRVTVQSTFPINRNIDTSRPIEVKINGAPIPTNAFHFDPTQRSIVFMDGAAPKGTANISVTFYPAP